MCCRRSIDDTSFLCFTFPSMLAVSSPLFSLPSSEVCVCVPRSLSLSLFLSVSVCAPMLWVHRWVGKGNCFFSYTFTFWQVWWQSTSMQPSICIWMHEQYIYLCAHNFCSILPWRVCYSPTCSECMHVCLVIHVPFIQVTLCLFTVCTSLT